MKRIEINEDRWMNDDDEFHNCNIWEKNEQIIIGRNCRLVKIKVSTKALKIKGLTRLICPYIYMSSI